jgi:hypothetical protein
MPYNLGYGLTMLSLTLLKGANPPYDAWAKNQEIIYKCTISAHCLWDCSAY